MSVDVPFPRADRAPHFRHPNQPSRRSTLSATTRLLSAATYLDDRFADEVVEELVADEHRAVVPSFFGLDLDPILRHAFHARQLHLWRHLALTAILIAG